MRYKIKNVQNNNVEILVEEICMRGGQQIILNQNNGAIIFFQVF